MNHDDVNDEMMTDDQLVALLAEAMRSDDPVPDRVMEGARAAFTWRTIDAELAELVYDSARDLAGVRADDANRQVTFRAPGVEIEVMVIDEGVRRLVGQLVPPAEVTIELVAGDHVHTVHTDRLGRFAFDTLAPGPVRLAVLSDDGASVVQTDWVLF